MHCLSKSKRNRKKENNVFITPNLLLTNGETFSPSLALSLCVCVCVCVFVCVDLFLYFLSISYITYLQCLTFLLVVHLLSCF